MKFDVLWLVFGVLACCAVALLAIAPENAVWVKDHEGAAAWVQAAFSMLAIFVALAYPRIHNARLEVQEYARQKRLLREIVLSAEGLLQAAAVCDGHDAASGAFVANASLPRWESIRDSLAAFPVTGLRTATEVTDLMTARSVMAEACGGLLRARQGQLASVGATHLIATRMQQHGDAFTHLTATV